MPKTQKYHQTTAVPVIYEILGWYGALAIVGSYILVTVGTVGPRSLIFQLANLTGGIAVALISWHKRAHQPVFINTFRAGTALVAIIALFTVTN